MHDADHPPPHDEALNLAYWVERMCRGKDAECDHALTQVFTLMEREMEGFLRALGVAHADLSAVANVVFFQCWRKRGNIREPAAFPAYARRVAIHAAHRAWRQDRRARHHQVAMDEAALRKEFARRLETTSGADATAEPFAGIPLELSDVLMRKYLREQTVKEIARDLDLTVDQVKYLLQCARRLIKEKLDHNPDEFS